MEYTTLHNGVRMPMLGYGVFQISPEECRRCVLDALEVGFRLIDTAQGYDNEEGVGDAITAAGIDRAELFLTSKVWISNASYDKAKASIDESLAKLRSDYIDLMLIHQPFGDYYGAYRALEDAYDAGILRAIGVSNFYPDRLIDISEFSRIVPHVNQIETHVFHQQRQARTYMDGYSIRQEAWGPFAEGRNDFFENPVLTALGKKHGKTTAQVALRFLIQSGVIAIPKSARRERMQENFDVFDIALDQDDMQAITALDTGESQFFSHQDPEVAKRLIGYAKNA